MRKLTMALLLALAAAVVVGCGGASDETDGGDNAAASGGDGSKGSLSLVAYSTPQVVYDEIIPAFTATPEGKGLEFKTSFGASGDQSRAVEAGQPADVVTFSTEPDMTRLVDANWAEDDHDGFVTNSVVVFAVRKGNPKNIKTWDDIARDDLEVITPNPFTSGGAKWNLMAAYGSQTEQGKSEEEGLEFLHQVLANTPVQDKSAREALQTFAGGKGDVLLAYENEAITAQKAGIELDYVVPDQTILIENPVAVTTESENQEQAKAFVDWLRTPDAQKIYAEKGYRSVLPDLVDAKTYPKPKTLFEIDAFGGWSEVNDKFFDPENGSVAQIERDLGVSTAN